MKVLSSIASPALTVTAVYDSSPVAIVVLFSAALVGFLKTPESCLRRTGGEAGAARTAKIFPGSRSSRHRTKGRSGKREKGEEGTAKGSEGKEKVVFKEGVSLRFEVRTSDRRPRSPWRHSPCKLRIGSHRGYRGPSSINSYSPRFFPVMATRELIVDPETRRGFVFSTYGTPEGRREFLFLDAPAIQDYMLSCSKIISEYERSNSLPSNLENVSKTPFEGIPQLTFVARVIDGDTNRRSKVGGTDPDRPNRCISVQGVAALPTFTTLCPPLW